MDSIGFKFAALRAGKNPNKMPTRTDTEKAIITEKKVTKV
jgi:hypothetical protein